MFRRLAAVHELFRGNQAAGVSAMGCVERMHRVVLPGGLGTTRKPAGKLAGRRLQHSHNATLCDRPVQDKPYMTQFHDEPLSFIAGLKP